MMVVGLTGGIGSGKSTIARMFSKHGVPVYNSDIRAKALYHENYDLQVAMVKKFGPEVYVNGELNRPFLAAKVFGDDRLLKWLNKLVHPLVKADFITWVDQQQFPYVIKEAAILFESKAYLQCDQVITVSAPREIRMQRVMDRDNVSAQDVSHRMAKQWTDAQREQQSDFVINNLNLPLVEKHVLELHEQLLKIARNA